MRNLTILFFCLLFFYPVFAQHEEVAGEFLIQLKSGEKTDPEKIFHRIEMVGADADIRIIRCISSQFNVYLGVFDETGITATGVKSLLKTVPGIRYVQANHRLSLRETFPDDLYFPDQWNLNNTGQTGGVEDADIDAPEAWDFAKGNLTVFGDTIVMAIIDDGFYLNHDDLNFFKNYHEIPGNGMDDDGNGFIDDYDGWNAYDHNGNIRIRDHGTHVSGIAGAVADNEIGVSGVTWGGKILPVSGTEEVEATLVECYDYVLIMRKLYEQTNGEKGAFVVSTNLSWGVNNGDPDDFPIWCAIYDSLGAYGILSAGATANANYNIDEVLDMPTACDSPFLITVTNTTDDDEKHVSAGYGATTIDLGAPGTAIYNTRQGNTYGFKSGTSMSTPHITAAVAVLFSAADEALMNRYKNDPATISLLFKDAILSTTDTVETLLGSSVSGGRLNLANAVQYILSPPQPAAISFASDSLLLTLHQGELADTAIVISNASDFPAPVIVSASDATPWMRFSDFSDTIPATSQLSVNVGFNADGLPPGDYYNTIAVQTSGYVYSLPLRMHVIGNVGIEEKAVFKVKVYSNPVLSNIISFAFEGEQGQAFAFELYDIDGFCYASENLIPAYSRVVRKITVPHSGLYVLHVYSSEGISETKKIIVR